MMSQNPALFWAIVVSMYIGNVMLLVLNLPLVGMWAQPLRLPYNVLFPLIVLFSIIGVYCSSNNVFDVHVMIAFGILGYLMRKTGYEPAPLVLAFVLGPMLENNLRKALILSQNELTTFPDPPDLRGLPPLRRRVVGVSAPAIAPPQARGGGAGRGGVSLQVPAQLSLC